MACLFRLYGVYANAAINEGVLRGSYRHVRERKTMEWLGWPGGVWRNGWYEHGSGQRWNVEMDSSDPSNAFGIEVGTFDTFQNQAHDCSLPTSRPAACDEFPVREYWGTQTIATTRVSKLNQLYLSNGSHFGHFMYQGLSQRTVQNKYSLETFLSNMSTTFLSLRWFTSMAAMLNAYRRGLTRWQTTGLGCLSSSRAFVLLPFILMPRLKHIMAAFWTIGCDFQGQQSGLSEAWFAVYPAMVEFVFLLFSLLNAVSKATYRRMSDGLAGPTLFVLAMVHYFRTPIAKLPVLIVDGRVITVVTSAEFEAMPLHHLFEPAVALRMNGNVTMLFYLKVGIVGLNLLPLLFSKSVKQSRRDAGCAVENTLALRAANVGGIGLSRMYITVSGPSHRGVAVPDTLTQVVPYTESRVRDHAKPDGGPGDGDGEPAVTYLLSGYEISRLGYIVLGDKYLLTYEDWCVVTTLAPLRFVEAMWNHRVTVFDVTYHGGAYEVVSGSRLRRLDDPELRRVPWYHITVGSFR